MLTLWRPSDRRSQGGRGANCCAQAVGARRDLIPLNLWLIERRNCVAWQCMTSLKDVGSPNDAEASYVPADGHFRAAVSGDVPENVVLPLSDRLFA